MSAIELESPAIASSWLDLSLDEAGRSLIEASAGTGKTWTIAVLYLRLLLQRELSPRQIVVATFTEASGQELRERIRLRVRDATRWSELAARGETPEGADAALDWLRQRWSSVSTPGADCKRLQLALSELDSAPIGTLHSLCQRILREYPFETGSQFDQGELGSGKDLLSECARDLLRRENLADESSGKPPSLLEIEQQLVVLLRPGVSVPRIEPDMIRASLPSDAAERMEEFASDTTIYTRTGARGAPQKTLHPALLELAKWCDNDQVQISTAGLGHLGAIEKNLLPEAWERLRDGAELTLVGDVFAAYQLIQDAPKYLLLAQRQALAKAMWEQRLAARNKLTFDSLLTRAHEAVTGNVTLAKQLCEAWPVALIDEFQDTDALQYGTLDAIYRSDEDGLRGRLVMIGDPKQAIYSFRGGDIDTYRRAAASVTDRLVLDTNYRSDSRLVEGFNQLYALSGQGLSSRDTHDIRYNDVKSGQAMDRYLVDSKPSLQPLTLHYLSKCPDDDAPSRKQAALEACANQIARMLASGSHQVEGTQLQPGHIAVLLPTHDAVADLRDLLNERGVPSVGAGRSSVFAGAWAQELQLILHAVQHPHSSAAIHAALATRLGGMDFGGLQTLRAEPATQARVSKQFEALRDVWAEAGVLAVVCAVLAAAASRLLVCGDGERAMTDVRHLGELLQDAEDEIHGASQLLAWLRDQREEARGSIEAEESQLRMESDARRVKLMTLHASKGLEFPVVFLPLMWAHGGRAKEIPLLPDEGGGRKVGLGDEAKRVFQQSAQDERFRVLYVALTRAQHACHVYVLAPARPKDGSTPKPAAGSERSALDVTIARLMPATNNGQDLATTAVGWSEGWPWTKPRRLALEEQDKGLRQARPMPGRVPVHERLHSFSSLSQGRHPVREEQPAADEEEVVLAEDDAELLPGSGQDSSPAASAGTSAADKVLKQLSWIRGAEFGNALHQVFEERRIGAAMADQHPLIDSALRQFGVRISEMPQTQQGARPQELTRAEAVARIAERVQAALDADLGGGIRLGDLPARALRAEMAFHYPVDGVRVAALRRLCAAHQIAFPNNATHRLYGLMHGKIDLVFEHQGRFHVLDYKGNQLGDRESGGALADYDRPSLDNVMRHHCYELQALFYTVAVERLLRQRVRDYQRARHLGDTIYLFVRAAGLAPAAGVWRHRFSDPLLDAADAILAGRAESEQEAQAMEGMEA